MRSFLLFRILKSIGIKKISCGHHRTDRKNGVNTRENLIPINCKYSITLLSLMVYCTYNHPVNTKYSLFYHNYHYLKTVLFFLFMFINLETI